MRFGKLPILLMFVGAATAALAHGKATGIVKERMDGMVELQEAMKAIGPMMQGKTDFDANVVREQAARMKAHAGDSISEKFPEGSGGMPSEANAEIWQDWETFVDLAIRLEMLSTALEQGAENGLMKDSSHGSMMNSETMQDMMSGNMTEMMDTNQLAEMPVDGLFMMIGKTCSACHEKFRTKME